MKKHAIFLFTFCLSLTINARDWDTYPIPATAGSGMEWQLQENISDEFNYNFEAATTLTTFNNRWKNFYHNSWNGPGTTYWQYNHVAVDGSNLLIKSSRNTSTSKMSVPGVNAGCITSTNRVKYPVFIEANVSVANITLASDVWLLSADDTQEIDMIECYGGAENGNSYFAQFIHLSHHSFIRSPFKDYQPQDLNSWWKKSGVSSWGAYCWNNGVRKYLRIGVNWIGPKHFEYYVDGDLVRVLYENAFATRINGTWTYSYPSMSNGVLNFSGGYQSVITYAANSNAYSFATLQAASNLSTTSVIDPYNYQGGAGFTKELDIIINMESQDWHVTAGRTPTDAELANPDKNTLKVDWIRVYKPVSNTAVNMIEDKTLQVYPNPCGQHVNIKSKQIIKQIQLCQLNGAIIKKTSVGSVSQTLELDDLATGLYFLKIESEDGNWTIKKIIKA